MGTLLESGRLKGLKRVVLNVLELSYKDKVEDLAACLASSEISAEEKKDLFIEIFSSQDIVNSPNITLGEISGMMKLVGITEFSICIKVE